jgi:hypothetical protein
MIINNDFKIILAMPVPPPIICTQHPNKNIKIKVEKHIMKNYTKTQGNKHNKLQQLSR